MSTPALNPAEQAVAMHIRELPSVALEALLDLIASGGPDALALAITEEIASRHTTSFLP